jgi:hypothetical protein
MPYPPHSSSFDHPANRQGAAVYLLTHTYYQALRPLCAIQHRLMAVWKLSATYYMASFALRPPVPIYCAAGSIHCPHDSVKEKVLQPLTGIELLLL